MIQRKAWARIEFYVELPDDDLEADRAFDRTCDELTEGLNGLHVAGALVGSFSIDDADTTSEGLDE